MAHSDLSVQQIADRLGFSSLSSFGKYVRRHFGCSPRAYKEQVNGKKEQQ